jgi:hypothetical protein
VLIVLASFLLVSSGVVFKEEAARWDIYMDAGFADAPCGFFDPKGKATGRYVRIALTCLQDTERIDIRSGR